MFVMLLEIVSQRIKFTDVYQVNIFRSVSDFWAGFMVTSELRLKPDSFYSSQKRSEVDVLARILD